MGKAQRRRLYLLILPLTILLLLFLVGPLLLILWESFVSGDGAFTLEYYARAFTSRLYRQSIGNSLKLALTTTVLGTLLGGFLSYAMFRKKGRTKELLLSLNSVPLTFSGLVIAFAFIVTFGTSGFVTTILARITGLHPLDISDFLFSWRGLVLAYSYFLIPRMILTMMASWSNVDWTLMEAAESLGASRWMTFRRVLLPVLAPAIMAGSSLLFAVSMGAFGTAFALTGTGVNILPLLVYTRISEVSVDVAQADALAIILTGITSIIVMLYQRAVGPKGYR